MAYTKKIIGRYVDLQSVTYEDAEFTLEIRQDPEFVKYLPRLNNTIEQQREWISHQREKQDDYFFVVYDKSGNKIGTCGIYNITEKRAETGRLALRGNAMQNLEAQLLLFGFGFGQLGLDEEYGFIYADNFRNQRSIQQFGGVLYKPYIDANDRMVCDVTLSKSDFIERTRKIEAFLYRKNRT